MLADLSFVPTETKMEVSWPSAPTLAARSSSDVLFLSGGSSIVPKALVKEEFRRLVEAVIERLSARQVHHSYLGPEWRAILDAEHDPEQKSFCEKAARLGCDPFDVADSVAAQIEHLGVLLPEPMAVDFLDAIPLAQMTSGAEAVKAFIDSASATALNEGRWREFREKLQWRGTEVPWRDGYNEARALRAYLGRSGAIATGLDSFLKQEFGSLEIREFEVAPGLMQFPRRLRRRLRCSASLRVFAKKARDLFCAARCLTISHRASHRWLTRTGTEHQQRNRAFAAEFLAPAESIRDRIGGDRVAEEDVEELAQEFQVSELVIRHQIQNDKLAWLGA